MQLPAILGLEAATALKAELLAQLAGGAAVVLDGSAVEKLTTPCAQVLLAAQQAAESQGTALHLISLSDYLRDALDALGLTALLCQQEPVS